MAPRSPETAAVVGAGLSGLVCARALQQAGLQVQVFEKSRGPGGRLATRRADYGSFDHGAQYFTARDPRFREAVGQWIEQGLAAVWSPRLTAIEAGSGVPVRTPVGDATPRHVGVPGMSRIGRALAEGLAVHANCRIAEARLEAGRWRLAAEDGIGADVETALAAGFDWLVAAVPSPQAAELFRHVPTLQTRTLEAPMVPCWALLARFAAPLDLDFDAAFVSGSSLTWIARDSAKPGRDAGECWVLHAARDWSAAELERSPEAIVAPMLAEFARVTGVQVAPATAHAHRWRYSGPAGPSTSICLFEPALAAGACGDWLAGGRVEGAWLSGRALAQRIIDTAAARRAG